MSVIALDAEVTVMTQINKSLPSWILLSKEGKTDINQNKQVIAIVY